MNSIRVVGDYSLNKSVNGMYNVTDQAKDTSLIATARMRVSLWLDHETKDELVNCSDEKFEQLCEELLKDEV